jgi:hypothetical protein
MWTPKFMKSGLAKTTLAPAAPDLHMLFPAKREAAYFGYENGMYMKSDCMVKKCPMTKMPTSISGTAQLIFESEVQANTNSPTGNRNEPKIAGTKRFPCSRRPLRILSGYHIPVQVNEVGNKSNAHANKARQEGKAGLSEIEAVKWYEDQRENLEERVEKR